MLVFADSSSSKSTWKCELIVTIYSFFLENFNKLLDFLLPKSENADNAKDTASCPEYLQATTGVKKNKKVSANTEL
ncbi:MAG: hypothetical protein EA343_10605 [Nodularia sp. (in: Bacteria)]|nr:MAG: hypothetical protein EA343_10605 [Nodularia sp. (in: cyanobacteria)]